MDAIPIMPVDSKPLNAVPTTPPGTDPPLPQSTPVKIESSTTLPFTTNQKYRIESCTTMGEEIKKYLVGPMPADKFLDKFFPVGKLSDLDRASRFTPNCYRRTVEAERETRSYKHFVSLFNESRYPCS